MPGNQWVDKMIAGSPNRQPAITNLTVTGDYGDDDTPIETAVNSILATLRAYGMIDS